MQGLATQLLPAVLALAAPGKSQRGKPAAATLAIGLVTSEFSELNKTCTFLLHIPSDTLQGKLSLDEAKQIIANLSKLLQDSNGWLEFLEQLVYILVAVTIPVLYEGAMRKIVATVGSS